MIEVKLFFITGIPLVSLEISDSMISDLLTLTVVLNGDGFVFLQSVVCFWLTGFYLFITRVGLVEFSYILT